MCKQMLFQDHPHCKQQSMLEIMDTRQIQLTTTGLYCTNMRSISTGCICTGHQLGRSRHSCLYSFQPVLHDWCNKGHGMCYPVCGMMHIKEPLLLIGKSSPCDDSGFLLSLSVWFFTICLTPYNRKENVLSVSLNKKFPFLPRALLK